MTFLQFLNTQTGEDTAVGDFARDTQQDHNDMKPKGAKVTKEDWVEYLKTCHRLDDDSPAMKAFESAWDIYDRLIPKS